MKIYPTKDDNWEIKQLIKELMKSFYPEEDLDEGINKIINKHNKEKWLEK